MTLYSKLQEQMREAIKTNNSTKDILRVLVGEISTLEGRTGQSPSDEQVIKIIKKLVESNEYTLKYISIDNDFTPKLLNENIFLYSFLPKELTEEVTAILIRDILQPIIESKSEGQAIGLAIKHLKSKQAVFNNEIVKKLVQNIRSEPVR